MTMLQEDLERLVMLLDDLECLMLLRLEEMEWMMIMHLELGLFSLGFEQPIQTHRIDHQGVPTQPSSYSVLEASGQNG